MRVTQTVFGSGILLIAALSLHPQTVQVAADEQLQEAADQAMAGHGGALVVVDVVSRRILAATSIELAAARLERPGSTLKPFVLMALLEAHKLDPKERLHCQRPLLIGSARMDCTHPASITQLDTDDAIS
jgi:cell division protein FtsI/penicillin-binding protein 2